LAAIPEVQAVFTSEFGKVFFVWAVVPERDQDLFRRIQEKEQSIIDSHLPIQFDFTILASKGKGPETLLTDPTVRLAYSRD
jgi:hypothetical protein